MVGSTLERNVLGADPKGALTPGSRFRFDKLKISMIRYGIQIAPSKSSRFMEQSISL